MPARAEQCRAWTGSADGGAIRAVPATWQQAMHRQGQLLLTRAAPISLFSLPPGADPSRDDFTSHLWHLQRAWQGGTLKNDADAAEMSTRSSPATPPGSWRRFPRLP